MSFVMPRIRPRLVCADGTCLSVQASETHYCQPRDKFGPYHAVEVGFPDVTPPDTWEPYADGPFPSDVYGCVPVDMVKAYIGAHGGLAEGHQWWEDMA